MDRFVITFLHRSEADVRNTSAYQRVSYTATSAAAALNEWAADHPDCTVIGLLRAGAVEPRDEAKIEIDGKTIPSRLPGPGEFTSEEIGTIAARALRNPASISEAEIQALAGSCLTQRPDSE